MKKGICCVFILALCAHQISAQNLAVAFKPALRQGLRYSYVEDYKIRVFQYSAELSIGAAFLIDSLTITPQLAFLFVPPPAADRNAPFTFRGDWGGGIGVQIAYGLFPWLDLGLEAGFDLRLFWNTPVLFTSPRLGVFALIHLKNYGESFGLALEPFFLYHFRKDSTLSLQGGMGLVFYL